VDPFDPLPLNVFGADNQGGNGDDNNNNNNNPGGGEEGRDSKRPPKRVQAWERQRMDKEIFNRSDMKLSVVLPLSGLLCTATDDELELYRTLGRDCVNCLAADPNRRRDALVECVQQSDILRENTKAQTVVTNSSQCALPPIQDEEEGWHRSISARFNTASGQEG